LPVAESGDPGKHAVFRNPAKRDATFIGGLAAAFMLSVRLCGEGVSGLVFFLLGVI
jgi:hypothetical protein